jgi:fibronectin type 3 domain-containing protein
MFRKNFAAITAALTLPFVLALTLLFAACPMPDDPSPGWALPAPSITDVTGGNAALTLTWGAVTDATAYKVYYHTADDSAGATQSGGDITATTATITGLTNGTLYYVWVKAKNAAGESDFSASGSGTPMAQAPAAPVISAVTPGNTQVTVTWGAVTGATAYKVYYHTADDSAGATQFGEDITTTTATITGLTNGTTYYVWVKAKNAIGDSSFSPSKSGTPVQLPAPSIIVFSKNGSLEVSWDTVTDATGYEVYYHTADDSAGATQFGGDITITTETITGLTNGTTYYVWVKAKDSGGTSDYSASQKAAPCDITNLKGYHQSSVSYSQGWSSNEWVFIDDGFVIDNGATTFTYYDTSTGAVGFAGNIAGIIAEDNTNGRIILKITDGGTWEKTVNYYYAVIYRNLSAYAVTEGGASKYGDYMDPINNGLPTLREAITEYAYSEAADSGYFAYPAQYYTKTVSPDTLSSILQGKWYYEDFVMYVTIRGNTFLYFIDGEDPPDRIYAPDDDGGANGGDFLGIAGEIVDCINNGASGILYIHTVVAGDVGYQNDKYEAVAWKNLAGNNIKFFFQSDNHASLADVKTAYTDPTNNSQFDDGGFYDFEKQ